MEKVSKPKVSLLGAGEKLLGKQMKANAGELLPKHTASVESVLVVIEGSCLFKLPEKEEKLHAGEMIIVPAEIPHQIKAIEDLTAIHIMPKDIKFEFFD